MASRTVVAYMQVMHTETGLWCPRCLLPSAVRVDLALTLGERGRLMLASRAACQDCGERVT